MVHRFDAITAEQLRRIKSTKWRHGDDYIGAFTAEMDFGIAPSITEALHREVNGGRFGSIPASLVEDLTTVTQSWLHDRYNWPVNRTDIHRTSDVVRAYEYAIANCCSPSGAVIVPTPAYNPFLLLPLLMGRRVIEVPMAVTNTGYSFDASALQAAFDEGGELLVLCSPYNPGGRVFRRDELEDLSDLVQRNGGRVFADEIWAPLTFPGYPHIPYASVNAASAGHTITAISASKAWNTPGIKCAQIITSNNGDRERWAAVGAPTEHGASNLGVAATIAAYGAGGREWLDDVVGYLDRNRTVLATLVARHLEGVRYRAPEGTYVAWLDFRNSPVPDQPAAFFKDRARVVLSEGTDCGLAGTGFARFIFATPLPVMTEAVERMGEAMREL